MAGESDQTSVKAYSFQKAEKPPHKRMRINTKCARRIVICDKDKKDLIEEEIKIIEGKVRDLAGCVCSFEILVGVSEQLLIFYISGDYFDEKSKNRSLEILDGIIWLLKRFRTRRPNTSFTLKYIQKVNFQKR